MSRRGGWGAAWLGVPARARRDGPMLLALLATVTVGALVALAGPQLVGDALDAGLRGAVEQAGGAGQLRVEVPLALDTADVVPGAGTKLRVSGADLTAAAASFTRQLPDELGAVHGPVWINARSIPFRVAAGFAAGTLSVRLGYVAGPGSGLDRIAAGGPAGHAVPVSVSRRVAEATGLRAGSRLELGATSVRPFTVEVTEVVAARDPAAAVWRELPTALAPGRSTREASRTEITLLVPARALAAAGEAMKGSGGFTATLRQTLDGAALHGDQVPGLQRALTELDAVPPTLQVQATPRTELPAVLRRYTEQAAAVRAQLSVLVVGAVGVAILLTLLAVQSLTARRRDDLALEHARGASLAMLAVRLAPESTAVAVLGCLLGGVLLAALSGPFPLTGAEHPQDAIPLLVVLLTVVLGGPLAGAWAARRAWAGAAGGRRAGSRLRSRRARAQSRSRRLVLESVLLLVAIGAVLSLRGRGGPAAAAEGFHGGVDPFLAAAPTLVAVVAALLAVRLQPWPLRVLAALARRGRGMVGLVATARATRGLAGIPLLALTLAVGITTASGLIRDTVLTGQEVASWQRIGAEVRATGSFTPADAERVRRAPGVRHVARLRVLGSLRALNANPPDQALVVAVDADQYAGVLADSGLDDGAGLRRLAAAATGGPVPVLLSADLAARMRGPDVAAFVGDGYHPVRPVGQAPVAALAGWLGPSVVIVDERAAGAPAAANLLLATGPGAQDAVSAMPGVSTDHLVVRARWLSGIRESALVHQVLLLSWLVILASGALAAAAVVSSVLTGARQRGRALAVLRALGLGTRRGRLLAIAELGPLIVVGGLAGAVGGVGIVVLLGPALGLDVLTRGVGQPALQGDPRFVLAVVAGLLAVFGLAAAAELAAHRHERLSDLMRT